MNKIKQRKVVIFIFLLCSFFILNSSFLIGKVMAQAISLSISPPLFEVMIQPGKEVKETYTISNGGGDTTITPKIVYFQTADEGGNINLTEDIAPDWVKYSKDNIKIKNGDSVEFNVVIAPPNDTEETDHFLTLLFETAEPTDVLSQSSSFFKSQIGTNILITVSKDGNPKKSAEIVEFTAPKIIDSLFGKINYAVKIKNNGNSFWKPNGKIVSGSETLKLAPFNILSGSTRSIDCFNNENVVSCNLQNKFLIGKIDSELEFTMDDDTKIYNAETTTISFPFIGVGALLILLTLYRYKGIFKLWRKRK